MYLVLLGPAERAIVRCKYNLERNSEAEARIIRAQVDRDTRKYTPEDVY